MAGDWVGCLRPHRTGCGGTHAQSGAAKALPALVRAVVAAVGAVGTVRLPLVRLVRRADPSDRGAAERQRRACTHAGAALHAAAGLGVAAGCGVAALLTGGVPRVVARVARHCTARRHVLPASQGRGRGPVYGARGRPVPRTRNGTPMAATPPEATPQWGGARRRSQAQVWEHLVLSTAKPGAPALRCAVLHAPRSPEPRV